MVTFLALLCVYTGCRLKPKVVATGVLPLSGVIDGVGAVVAQVKEGRSKGGGPGFSTRLY